MASVKVKTKVVKLGLNKLEASKLLRLLASHALFYGQTPRDRDYAQKVYDRLAEVIATKRKRP